MDIKAIDIKIQLVSKVSSDTESFLTEAANLDIQDKTLQKSLVKSLANIDSGCWISSVSENYWIACGKIESDEHLQSIVSGFMLAANKQKIKTATLDASKLLSYKSDIYSGIQKIVHAVIDQAYCLPTGLKKEDDKFSVQQVDLIISNEHKPDAEQALSLALAVAQGAKVTKDLGNLPGNIANSTYILDLVKSLCEKYPSLKLEKIVDEAEMKKLGMHSFLSVNKGTIQPPYLLVIKYDGNSSSSDSLGLLGKGITFDSGGISLKPGAGMGDMKYDMCGAAGVIGTMVALAHMGSPVSVIGAVALAENMPSGSASRPGDIITSMNGKTIEINNTDAEGRLVLCDSLTYLQRNYKLSYLIDMATLTGSVIVGLGKYHTGVFSNDDGLANALLDAGEVTGDIAWRLPLHKKFHEQMKTNHADLSNIGGTEGGTCTAAAFLEEFVEDGVKWAHMDIAGTANISGKAKAATARPIYLLAEFIRKI